MKLSNQLVLSTSPLSQTARKPCGTPSLTRRQRLLYGRKRHHSTVKERDTETGLYYYGARYLDSKTSRWISGDPAVGDYVPKTDGEADNLPGMGGVYNTANLHVYHYSNNNPVRYKDPDGNIVNLAAAGIGAAIGAGVGAAFAIAAGGSGRDIAAAAAGGAVTGALGGLTMGASLAVGMAGAGLAGMAGYGTQQLVADESTTLEGYAYSGVSGVAGYAAGQIAGKGITAISNRISASQTTTSSVGGVAVIKDNSIIEPKMVDANGETNLARMEKGLAPIGSDGKSINLHHVNQTMTGPVQEMTATNHQQNYSSLHTNTGQRPSLVDRRAFDKWRTDVYWPTRADDFK